MSSVRDVRDAFIISVAAVARTIEQGGSESTLTRAELTRLQKELDELIGRIGDTVTIIEPKVLDLTSKRYETGQIIMLLLGLYNYTRGIEIQLKNLGRANTAVLALQTNEYLIRRKQVAKDILDLVNKRLNERILEEARAQKHN